MSDAVLQVSVSDPLSPYVDGFREALGRQGYAMSTVEKHLGLLAHMSGWLMSQALTLSDLKPARTHEFLRARNRAGYVGLRSQRALKPLLEHLQGMKLLPAVPPPITSPMERVLASYRDYLVAERGLAATTVSQLYRHGAHILDRPMGCPRRRPC